MRVIRSSGQNVSPSDDGRLYQQAFKDGLFEPTTINSLGGNLVSIGAMYGIMQGRDFTVEAQNINVELPSEDDTTGYIYVQFDTTTADVITVESALAPFTPTYDDINTNGTICQMVIATYQASAVAVTSITSVYDTATTKTDPTLVGSVAMNETSPATSSHAVGTYLFYNRQLYEVTAAIAVGETLVAGTNIVATSVGNEISDLKPNLFTPYRSVNAGDVIDLPSDWKVLYVTVDVLNSINTFALTIEKQTIQDDAYIRAGSGTSLSDFQRVILRIHTGKTKLEVINLNSNDTTNRAGHIAISYTK